MTGAAEAQVEPSRRGELAALASALVSLAVLNTSVTFGNVWPTPKIRWQPMLSVELAAIALALMLLHRHAARLTRRVLPAAWVFLVFGHYVNVTAPGLYGRPFNLYWDAPHLTNVVAMLGRDASWSLVAGILVGVPAMAAALFFAARVALSQVAAAVAGPRARAVLAAGALAVIAMFAFEPETAGVTTRRVFASPIVPAYARQARTLLAVVGPGAVAPRLAVSPPALSLPLDGLGGADVLLLFVESYGAMTFDDEVMTTALAESRAALDDAIRETDRTVVSAYVESPTVGSSSWLAHLTLLTGVDVRDPYSYASLMTESRETLITAFRRRGYRTVGLMPGLRQPWPEGAFYGFDMLYGRQDLAYPGPDFGWWGIPDQYALAKLDALERDRPSRAPVFVVFPTSTTHAPFGPVPPYQVNWARMLDGHAFDPPEVARAMAITPDLTNLRPDYARAMSYEIATLAGYVRWRASDDFIMILVGDHQPPAAVSGPGVPWDVPVHVITRQRRVIDRLVALGFQPGTIPTRPRLGGMHDLTSMLMQAFSAPANSSSAAVRPRDTPLDR